MKTVALLLDDAENQYRQLLVREAQAQASRLDCRLLEPQFAGGSSWTQLETIQSFLRKPTGRPDAVVVMLARGQMTASAFTREARSQAAVERHQGFLEAAGSRRDPSTTTLDARSGWTLARGGASRSAPRAQAAAGAGSGSRGSSR